MAPKLPSFLQKHAKPSHSETTTIFRTRPPQLLKDDPALPKPKPASRPAPETQSEAAGEQVTPPAPAKPTLAAPQGADPAKAQAPEPAQPVDQRGGPHLALVEKPDEAPAFRVVPMPRLAQGGRWRTEAMRSYPFPVLLWFTRGQGRITVSGVTRGFGPHNAVFLPAGTMHGFEPAGQIYGNALFFPRDTEVPLPAEPFHLRFRDAPEQAEMSLLIDNIDRELQAGRPMAERAIALHAELLSIWLERHMARPQTVEAPEKAAQKLSAAYSALVERDFRSGKTVAGFAAELGVTPTHLTRSCNAACGRSAHDILTDRIFYEARQLLRQSEAPVKDIASQLGFASAAYFTRAFQKTTGETPRDFRSRN